MRTELWVLIGLVALMAAIVKAIGPIALGGRKLPGWFDRVIALLAPCLLASLVVTQALADEDRLHIGADTAGVACAGLVFWRGGSVLVGAVVAIGVTAGLRAVG